MQEITVFLLWVFLIGAVASIDIDEERINSTILEIFDENFGNIHIENSTPTTAEPCTCVPFTKCDNGATQLSIRFDPIKDECPFLQLCCPPHLIKEDKCLPGTHVNVGCGAHNKNGVCFNITDDNANEAKFGEFPWMVAVLEKLNDDDQLFEYICGGSLIAPGVVLTAAHCVYEKSSNMLKIRAGEWDTQTTNEPFPYQDRLVSHFVFHPEFIRKDLYYDVALLFLQQPVNITDNVNTVCLPNADDTFDDVECFSSGWGQDFFGDEGTLQVFLKRIKLPIVPFKSCNQKLKETSLGRYFQLHPSFICAGGEPGHDMCTGDGGSPLVCPISGAPGRYAQAGLVSAGIGCGNSVPGIYANVPFLRSWIDEQMKLNHLTTNSYLYP